MLPNSYFTAWHIISYNEIRLYYYLSCVSGISIAIKGGITYFTRHFFFHLFGDLGSGFQLLFEGVAEGGAADKGGEKAY